MRKGAQRRRRQLETPGPYAGHGAGLTVRSSRELDERVGRVGGEEARGPVLPRDQIQRLPTDVPRSPRVDRDEAGAVGGRGRVRSVVTRADRLLRQAHCPHPMGERARRGHTLGREARGTWGAHHPGMQHPGPLVGAVLSCVAEDRVDLVATQADRCAIVLATAVRLRFDPGGPYRSVNRASGAAERRVDGRRGVPSRHHREDPLPECEDICRGHERLTGAPERRYPSPSRSSEARSVPSGPRISAI